jgi:voltage-gated potassium channel
MEAMTSDQRVKSRPTAAAGWEELPVRRRRRLLTIASIRSLASAAVLVTAYFLLPFTRLSNGNLIAEFVVGVLLVVVVLTGQTVATLRSGYPLLRSAEAMATTIPLFLVVFSTTHYLINGLSAGSYSEPMTRFDALYFTITTFATVGFGDITPVSFPARFVTLVQMMGGLILIGVVARVLIGAARLRGQNRLL